MTLALLILFLCFMVFWPWSAVLVIMCLILLNTYFWSIWFQVGAALSYLAESQRKLGSWLRP